MSPSRRDARTEPLMPYIQLSTLVRLVVSLVAKPSVAGVTALELSACFEQPPVPHGAALAPV